MSRFTVLEQIISGPIISAKTSSHRYLILSYLILSYFFLSYLILSYLILSYLILSYLTLSYLILSYLILSYLISRDTGVQTEDESEGSVNGWKFPAKVNLITYSYSLPAKIPINSQIVHWLLRIHWYTEQHLLSSYALMTCSDVGFLIS